MLLSLAIGAGQQKVRVDGRSTTVLQVAGQMPTVVRCLRGDVLGLARLCRPAPVGPQRFAAGIAGASPRG